MDIETFPHFGSDRQELDQAVADAWDSLGFKPPARSDVFIFFRSLGGMLTALSGSGRIDTVADVMRHVDYLADKAGCSSASLLNGDVFSTDPRYTLEGLGNIAATLRLRNQLPMEDTAIPADIIRLIADAEARLPGWCTREKAECIAQTILNERPMTCVEIGIFGGRSLVPAAAALRANGAGVIYGVEAWSPVVAVQNPTDAVNDEWWSTVDFDRVKHDFYRFIVDMNLTRQVRVVEAPSSRAAGLFDEIDFLHIDGAHSMINAAEDLILYGRKVRHGGIIVFDDFNWHSIAPARALAESLCEPVSMLKDPATGQEICAVLRRR